MEENNMAKFTKKGLVISDGTVRVNYGSFALFAAEVVYLAKGAKDGGIKGCLKNLGKLTAAEVAVNAPNLVCLATGHGDCKFVKAWNKVARLVGTEWNLNGFED